MKTFPSLEASVRAAGSGHDLSPSSFPRRRLRHAQITAVMLAATGSKASEPWAADKERDPACRRVSSLKVPRKET